VQNFISSFGRSLDVISLDSNLKYLQILREWENKRKSWENKRKSWDLLQMFTGLYYC